MNQNHTADSHRKGCFFKRNEHTYILHILYNKLQLYTPQPVWLRLHIPELVTPASVSLHSHTQTHT